MGSSLVLLVRMAELVVATLVITWALEFRSSFIHHSDSSSSSTSSTSQLDHLYAVLHPVLMVIGFIVLTGEGTSVQKLALGCYVCVAVIWVLIFHGFWFDPVAAIMAHRWLAGWSRGTRKSMHLSLQAAALGFGVMGTWAKFRGERGVVANFYSLHSWMGLLCLALFFAQWMVGFMSFFHRGEGRRTRESVLPWHVFIGLYTYAMAVATAECGLLEKLTFLQKKGRIATRSVEASLVNGLGLGLALLGGFVVFAAVAPRHTSKLKMVTVNGHGNGKVVDKEDVYHQQQGERDFVVEDTNGKWK